MALDLVAYHAVTALLAEGDPLALDDATLVDHFVKVPFRTPATAKLAERVQMYGVPTLAPDDQLHAPLRAQPCLAYGLAVRQEGTFFQPPKIVRKRLCARFALQVDGALIDIDPTHVLLVFEQHHRTAHMHPSCDLKALREAYGFVTKPTLFAPPKFRYFEAVFALGVPMRIIGFVAKQTAADDASATPYRQQQARPTLYGTADIPLLIALSTAAPTTVPLPSR
ncbi:MAG TPA: hypothetical protein PLF40_17170 [Kofleriaceae bacterium]|nr:hypothetical protein [Kofleriaceae bacterium]